MNFFIDNKEQKIIFEDNTTVPLYSKEGFKIISDLYLKVGWDQKHLYSFTWLGRPLIQEPEDILRIQEIIYTVKPDVIIETGIAHGGSLMLSASLCKAMKKGRVIGIDIEIRPHNRNAIENHELFDMITLIERDSIANETIQEVKEQIKDNETVLIILDSCHDYQHVLKELKLYGPLVSAGSYIVATDGSQEYLNITPRAKVDYPHCDTWESNNPKKAAQDFVAEHKNFKIVEPKFLFNEGNIDFRITHWPCAFIQRIE